MGVPRLEGLPLDPLVRVVTSQCFGWRTNPRLWFELTVRVSAETYTVASAEVTR